jgi:hypothetical protein
MLELQVALGHAIHDMNNKSEFNQSREARMKFFEEIKENFKAANMKIDSKKSQGI